MQLEIAFARLPNHILNCSHFKDYREFQPDEQTFIILDQYFVETLDVNSNQDITKLITSDFYLSYSLEDRALILTNIYNYWANVAVEQISFPKTGSVLELEAEYMIQHKDWDIMRECYTRNYTELLYFMYTKYGAQYLNDNDTCLYKLMYYGVCNQSLDTITLALQLGIGEPTVRLLNSSYETNNLELCKLFYSRVIKKLNPGEEFTHFQLLKVIESLTCAVRYLSFENLVSLDKEYNIFIELKQKKDIVNILYSAKECLNKMVYVMRKYENVLTSQINSEVIYTILARSQSAKCDIACLDCFYNKATFITNSVEEVLNNYIIPYDHYNEFNWLLEKRLITVTEEHLNIVTRNRNKMISPPYIRSLLSVNNMRLE
jgi:hypothetical protein